MSGTSRNALCPCGSGEKYKKCCLPKEEAARKPQTGQDAVLVLMPTRGQICVETQLAIENNMLDVPHRMLVRQGRKPIVEARNTLAKFALHLQKENPFAFTPRELFAMWIDDDAWFPPGLPATMLRCMGDFPKVDALFGMFGVRSPYAPVSAWRISADRNSFPKVGIDCKPHDVVDIAEAGFHLVMMRLSLLERLGENPFDPRNESESEDIAFCRRAKEIGARLAVGMGFPVLHIDARDGTAYQPGMPTMMMEGNSARQVSLEHATPAGALKTAELREYGFGDPEKLAQETAAQIQSTIEQRRKVSAA
jgi:hypothetical protein